MDWDEAMEDAKEALGYSPDEWIADFDEVVDMAKFILSEEREREYYEFCDDAKYEHSQYLKSERWKKIRLLVLERDNFKCKDCWQDAVDVHHLDYEYLNTIEEINYCISLCRSCHEKRHD